MEAKVTPIVIFTSGMGWFGWAVIMTIDMFLLQSKRQRDAAASAAANLMKCPACAEMIQREARICRFCQTKIAA